MRSLQILSLATIVSAGIVSVPFSRTNVEPPASIVKRGTLDLTALNNITGGGYYAEFDVGTPGQTLSFLLDTGSSDTWVNSIKADVCTQGSLQWKQGIRCMATFDPSNSSTFQYVNPTNFDITYIDGRNIKGDYFDDTIVINGKTIEKQQLGLALQSSRPTGIMGLGFSSNVVAKVQYPTILDNMVSKGYIDASAFSLYLNDLSSNQGSILFGGFDQAKFQDKLVTFPLKSDFQSQGKVTSFTISLQGLDVHGTSDLNYDSFKANAVLDSGSTISLLPNSQAQPIHDMFDVKTFTGVQAPFIDCAWRGDKGKDYTFTFKFAGKNITIPMEEMVINALDGYQDQIINDPTYGSFFKGWEGICLFGIGNANDFGVTNSDFALLGDTFLRSAYVVYDLTNKQLGLAQAKLNVTDTDIVELKAGDKVIPNSESSAGKQVTPAVVITFVIAVGAMLTML